MSKTDKLKERLSFFVKEENATDLLKIPYRVICGSKLDAVAVILQDLLRDKHHKEFKCTSYEDNKIDCYVFVFQNN
jgi:hypothetical protein